MVRADYHGVLGRGNCGGCSDELGAQIPGLWLAPLTAPACRARTAATGHCFARPKDPPGEVLH